MIQRHKRTTLMLLLILCLGAGFWSGSRYPQLIEKALMGSSAMTEDPLTFDAVIQSQPSDPISRKIAISAINWTAENRNGMLFGFLLGAGFLSLFSMLEKRGTGNAFTNALIGLGTGMPLGVCVNCAAPIARGLHVSGARIETTLAAMFASPTMNVVVLTMMFSIFPFYLVAIKVGLTLVFILLVIPLLSRTAFREVAAQTYDDSSCPIGLQHPPQNETWLEAALGTTRLYFGSLWYIVKTTLPLMVLAAVLAAIAVQVIPVESVANLQVGALSMLAVSAVGIFLPLPIALDIVLSATLLALGVPLIYVATFLFTLGIYSVYSFSIVWTTISPKVAIVLTFVLMGMGIVAGVAADQFYQHDMKIMFEALEDFS
jgi:uncharacterized membrane protein YraQ (UPF0718 family)